MHRLSFIEKVRQNTNWRRLVRKYETSCVTKLVKEWLSVDSSIDILKLSMQCEIISIIIQGSGIQPISHVINAVDLKAFVAGNEFVKQVDDTCPIILHASNIDTRASERDNIELWAKTNCLMHNRSKCHEIVITEDFINLN